MTAEKRAGKNKTAGKKQSAEVLSSEINAPRWSVVSFEKRVAENLTYAAAAAKLKEIQTQKISGLCIVTDEAAARISQ